MRVLEEGLNRPTEELIARLVADATPLRPLRSPLVRTAVWLAWAAPWVAAVVWIMGLRPDLGVRAADARWLVEESAAMMTALAAAVAAFCAGIPGRPRWERCLPLLPLAIWLGALGQGCAQDWLQFGGAGLAVHPDWVCLPGVVLVGVGPAVAIATMILRGSPVAPATTAMLGALAAGGLAGAALPLIHRQDASVMILVWQVGTVLGLTALAGLAGRSVLRWRPDLPGRARGRESGG